MTRKDFDSLKVGVPFVGAVGYGPHQRSYNMSKSTSQKDKVVVILSSEKACYYHYRSIHKGSGYVEGY